jgi:hypothetical protein
MLFYFNEDMQYNREEDFKEIAQIIVEVDNPDVFI